MPDCRNGTVLSLILCCVLVYTGFTVPARAETRYQGAALSTGESSVWENGIGSGFRSGRMAAGFGLGAGLGFKAFGSHQQHDLALASVYIGWILSDPVMRNTSLRGNWELLVELFGGAQFEPNVQYVVGLTPFIRYNFATGSRFIPYLEGGAGIAETDIGRPDLSTRFQFNLQAGAGLHYFFRADKAVFLQTRFVHFSNAGIELPNNGVNTQMFSAGISWFF